MNLTFEERLLVETGLEQLYKEILSNGNVINSQIRQYIDAGEYGLALDDLADLYIETKNPLPSATLVLFDALATKMKMKSGDEWLAVAEILSTKQGKQRS